MVIAGVLDGWMLQILECCSGRALDACDDGFEQRQPRSFISSSSQHHLLSIYRHPLPMIPSTNSLEFIGELFGIAITHGGVSFSGFLRDPQDSQD